MSRNVLVVFSGLLPSVRGSNVLVRQSCRALGNRGHTIRLCCFARPGHAPTEQTPQIPFRVHTAAPVRLSSGHRSNPHPGRFLSDVKLAALVHRVAREQRPDLIHAHHYEAFAAALPTARLLDIPIILHAHSLFEEELPTYVPWAPAEQFLRAMGGVMDRELPVRAAAIIAVTDTLASALDPWKERRVPTHVIPPGVLGEEVDLPNAFPRADDPLVVYTGNTDRYQELPFLLNAFAQVRDAAPRARLHLVCSDMTSRISGHVERLGLESAVETIVTQDHITVRRHLRRAWLAVSPRSSKTGFPLKILDAMAVVRPVVACQGSAKAVIDGVTGLVVPEHDPSAMAQAILQLIHNPTRAATMGRHARDLVLTAYTWQTLARRIEAVWDAVLAESGSS